MNGQSSTRRRRRMRTAAEQAWWDRATPRERLAFTLGYVVGQGIEFPNHRQIDVISIELGVKRPPKLRTASKPRSTSSGQPRRTYDLEVVAATARAAIASGTSAADAVMEACGCPTKRSASSLITKARNLGHDIPHVNAGVAAYHRARTRGGES